MNPFDIALAKLSAAEKSVRARTADGETIHGGMQAIRDAAIRQIEIMRELIETLAAERGAP